MRARRATAEDVEAICRIRAEGWRETYTTEQWVAVVEGNAKGIPFHEARGFRRSGTRPAFDEGSAPESILFRRLLA